MKGYTLILELFDIKRVKDSPFIKECIPTTDEQTQILEQEGIFVPNERMDDIFPNEKALP